MQPSAEEYRRRYIENIQKLLLTQSKLVAYSATISEKGSVTGSGGAGGVCVDIIPPLPLGEGRLVYDVEQAKAQSADCNLRTMRSLWTGVCVLVCVCACECMHECACVYVCVRVLCVSV